MPHFGCVPESEFITLPPCEPDKHSFLGSCQLLLELPEGLEHFAERGCPPPRLPISSQLAPALLSWTITSHPARKGPRLGLVETYYSLSNVVNISSLFSPQELS